MRTIELSKVNSNAPNNSGQFSDTDDVGENQAAIAATAVTFPVTIQVEAIRCFYRRHNDQPGTRITFTDGGGFAVSESYEEVKTRIADLLAP